MHVIGEQDLIREVMQDMKKRGASGRAKRTYGWDVVEGELIPNADEQAAIEDILAMRQAGARYSEIGRHVELSARAVKRILDRIDDHVDKRRFGALG